MAGLRRSKIPPNSWDDISLDKQVYVPQRVADGMAAKAESFDDIVRHLMHKFKMRLGDAEYMATWAIREERRKVPDGLLGVYCEKEIVR